MKETHRDHRIGQQALALLYQHREDHHAILYSIR
jgi:hypothetical protein